MTEKDFEKITFNPVSLNGELIQDKYKELGRRDIFSIPLCDQVEENTIDDSKALSDIIKYVILFIDTNSPFWDELDISEREKQCLKWSGITKKDRAFEHISKNSLWFQEIMTAYFKFVNNDEYEMCISIMVNLGHLNKYLRSGINSENPESSVNASIKLIEKMKQLNRELDNVKKLVFPKSIAVQRKIAAAIKETDGNFVGYIERFALVADN